MTDHEISKQHDMDRAWAEYVARQVNEESRKGEVMYCLAVTVVVAAVTLIVAVMI